MQVEDRMKVLVVFSGESTHAISRFLKPGFLHCFVALQRDEAWIALDGGFRNTHVYFAAHADFDLKTFYEDQGYTVLEVWTGRIETRNPLMIGSCVGMIKRLIGVGAPLVWTPWQLYKHLTRG